MGTTTRTGPHHVRRMVVLGAVASWAFWLLVAGQGDLLVGLAVWSLVAIPFAILIIALGRHSHDVGGFLGRRDLFEGHGPDDRDRRR
jgi:hypothetical protein